MLNISENNLISVEVAKIVRYKYVIYKCSRKGKIVQIYQNFKLFKNDTENQRS